MLTAIPRPRVWTRPRREISVGAYVAAVVCVTALATLAALVGPLADFARVQPDWLMVAAMAALVVLFENHRLDLFGHSSETLTFVPTLALALLVGPGVAMMVLVPAILLARATATRPWYKLVFNASVIPLASLTGASLFYQLTGGPEPDQIVRDLPALVLAAEAAFLVNTGLLAVAVGLSSGRSPRAVWVEKYRWLAPHYIVLGLTAYAGCISYLELGPPGMAIFAMPVAVVWIAMSQYTSRTREGVERLHDANRALRRNEERFRSLVQNAPGFIAVLNADGTLQYLSMPSATGEPADGTRSQLPGEFISLVRPQDRPEVSSAIADVLANPEIALTVELQMNAGEAEAREYSAIVKNLLGDDAVHGIVVNARDVTDRKTLEDQLRYQALHDVLTGLPNRALFHDRLEQALAGAARRERHVAVLLIDLDRFKVINDSLGHVVGDELLVAAGQRLRSHLREEDTVARFGGDEFAVMIEDVENAAEAEAAAMRVLVAFEERLSFGARHALITASVGVAVSSVTDTDAADLTRRADVAVFRAKEEGRARLVVYDDAVDASSTRQFDLETDLRQAIDRDQLRLVYQPEIDLHTGLVVGFEALVRWEHPGRGLVSPQDFIPLAEETGEIIRIGQWVLEEACRQAQAWRLALPALGHFTVAVNLSAPEFLEPDLVWRVAKTLRDTGLDASMLRIEITETVVMRDTHIARKVFFELKGLGVEIAIDDFGTGYSSLNYLRRLPADVLKVDRSFVIDVDRDEREASIVRAVVHVANALNMHIVAEGIERLEQSLVLAELGCQTAQGYYFSRPQSAELIEAFVRERHATAARTA
ncbi:MAG: EAL domain-containing protein [Chloroflexi bacterium]|nr:EAL domain-containing protein [Chloroflexota bacterium]MDA1003944.1 EAL domain-containing protein [Chloroflexota bacterium]